VYDALSGMAPDRPCFRQVSGVLIEQTVAEAKPFLASHLAGITQIVTTLLEQKAKKEAEWKQFATAAVSDE
jgi:hypothetical protein